MRLTLRGAAAADAAEDAAPPSSPPAPRAPSVLRPVLAEAEAARLTADAYRLVITDASETSVRLRWCCPPGDAGMKNLMVGLIPADRIGSSTHDKTAWKRIGQNKKSGELIFGENALLNNDRGRAFARGAPPTEWVFWMFADNYADGCLAASQRVVIGDGIISEIRGAGGSVVGAALPPDARPAILSTPWVPPATPWAPTPLIITPNDPAISSEDGVTKAPQGAAAAVAAAAAPAADDADATATPPTAAAASTQRRGRRRPRARSSARRASLAGPPSGARSASTAPAPAAAPAAARSGSAVRDAGLHAARLPPGPAFERPECGGGRAAAAPPQRAPQALR